MGRTGDFTEVAAHTPLCPVIVPQQAKRPPVGIGDCSLLPRILEGDRAVEHMLEGDLHRIPDLVEESRVQQFLRVRPDLHALPLSFAFSLALSLALSCGVACADASRETGSIFTQANLKYGTPVTESTATGMRSLIGGSLKCSGKKQDPGMTERSSFTPISNDPCSDVTWTRVSSVSPSRSISCAFIWSRPALGPIVRSPDACVDSFPEWESSWPMAS